MAERMYTVTFTGAASALAIDFFELKSGASRAISLHSLHIGQTTELGDSAEEQIPWSIKIAGGSYTSGSGGSAPTPAKTNNLMAAPTFTAETANTTQAAVGTGTLVTVHQDVFNVRTGLYIVWTPETRLVAGLSEALVVGMAAAPVDSITWHGTAYVSEIF